MRYVKLAIACAAGYWVGRLVGGHDAHHSLARVAWTAIGFVIAHYAMMML
jgi:hypothetical protein